VPPRPADRHQHALIRGIDDELGAIASDELILARGLVLRTLLAAKPGVESP